VCGYPDTLSEGLRLVVLLWSCRHFAHTALCAAIFICRCPVLTHAACQQACPQSVLRHCSTRAMVPFHCVGRPDGASPVTGGSDPPAWSRCCMHVQHWPCHHLLSTCAVAPCFPRLFHMHCQLFSSKGPGCLCLGNCLQYCHLRRAPSVVQCSAALCA
jgi:hypothetical protein